MQQNPLANLRHKDFEIKSNKLCETISQFRIEEGNNGKAHSDFLKNIDSEIEKLRKVAEGNFTFGSKVAEGKSESVKKYIEENFKESTYKDKQNQERRCYILTKDSALQMLNRESAYVRMQTSIYIDKLENELYHKSLGIERNVSAVTHAMLSDFVGDDNRMIGLSKTIYNITSYRINSPYIYVKEELYMVNRENISIYDEVLSRAYDLVGIFRTVDKEHYMSNVLKVLKTEFIDDMDKYEKYISTHEKRDFVVQRGFGR